MDADVLLYLAVVADLMIALGYVSLGLLLASKFDAAAPTRTLLAFKASGLLFFLLCAATHAHLAWHAWTGAAGDPLAGHTLLIHVPQAVAALVASVLGWSFISLRIYDKSWYGPFLDRAIDRQAQEIAAQVRQSDVEHLATQARLVHDAAEVIAAAMQHRKEL